MRATTPLRWLVLVTTVVGGGIGGGCLVDDPSYLEPTAGSGDASGSSAGPSTSGPSATSGSTGSPTGSAQGTSSADTSDDSGSTTGCRSPAAGWWDDQWPYRRQLSFDNTAQAEDLSDFTALIVLRSGDFDYSHATPNGSGLRLIDADDATTLPFHVERWDPSGDSFLWVRVPTIDGGSADDHVWLYYGNRGAPDAQDPAGSYDAAEVAVWHLEESAGAHFDSVSGSGCLWEGGGGGSQDAAGQIAGAVEFDGNEDNIACGADQIVDADDHTITAWVRMPLTGDNNQQLINVESNANPFRGIGLYVRRNDGAIGKWLGSGYDYAMMPANQVQADQWAFLAIRGHKANTGGYVEVSQNGGEWEAIATGNTSNLEIESGTTLVIGKWDGPGPNASAQGTIDEVRISSAARSDDWVRAQYLSSSDQFVTDQGEQARCP